MRIEENQTATVFNVKKSEYAKNTMIGNISTYEGKNSEDKPIYSSWRTKFVGDAFKKSQDLEDKDKIIILSGKITRTYIKETDKEFVEVVIFDFDLDEE